MNKTAADDTLGVEFFTAKKYDLAIQEFSKTISADKNDPEPYVARGGCYYALKNYELGIKDELMAIALIRRSKPIDKSLLSQAYSNKALIETKQDKFQEALKDAKQASKLDGGNDAAQSILNDLAVKYRDRSIARCK